MISVKTKKTMTPTKICSKCGEKKPLEEFNKYKRKKDGLNTTCRNCSNKYAREYYRNNIEHRKKKHKEHYQNHKERINKRNKKYKENHKEEASKQNKEWYERTGRQQKGKTSMYKDKSCTAYLGIVVAERLCRHLFKDVQVMSYGNPKFDFICNHGKKIDVKSACITIQNNKYPRWLFRIRKNVTADFFILVAFDNRTDLNPLHLWMIPGHEINQQGNVSISPSTIHKWDKWKMDINGAQICCTEMKNH